MNMKPITEITEPYSEAPSSAKGAETKQGPSRRRSVATKPAAAPSRPKKGSKPKAAKKGRGRRRKTELVASSPIPRPGTKIAQILELLRRTGGAAVAEFTQLTGWQPHSVRGFLSGVIGKKHGLKVVSSKGEDGIRRYSLPG